MKILKRRTGNVIIERDVESIKDLVEIAVREELDLEDANLEGADLKGADLKNAKLKGADLMGADLEGANLEGADLMDADLEDTNLKDAKGLASKEEEMIEAKKILEKIKSLSGKIKMDKWHTCNTSHCLAGWCLPGIPRPAVPATLKIPTVSKYFFKADMSHEDAIKVLERVARGEESIYN